MLKIHFILLTIGQMTHTTVSFTHYYSQYSHRSIISLHGSLLDTVTFFSAWLTLAVTFFPCYFFFLAKSVTFYPLLFFLLLSFRAPGILSSPSFCSLSDCSSNSRIETAPSAVFLWSKTAPPSPDHLPSLLDVSLLSVKHNSYILLRRVTIAFRFTSFLFPIAQP